MSTTGDPKRRPPLGVVSQMAEVRGTSSRQRWTLLLVCTAAFMLLLDITIVSVALPSIQRDLHASLPDLQWVSAAYALVLAVLLLPAATLGDRLGRRRLFLAGLVIFTAGSLACALAPTALALELFRALQGAGGAGELRAQQRRAGGEQHRAAGSLQRAEQLQRQRGRGQRARQRPGGEDDQAGQEQPAPAQPVTQGGRRQQQHRQHQGIGGAHPLQVRQARPQIPLNRRQRHAHHGDVQQQHERRRAHQQQRPPLPRRHPRYCGHLPHYPSGGRCHDGCGQQAFPATRITTSDSECALDCQEARSTRRRRPCRSRRASASLTPP